MSATTPITLSPISFLFSFLTQSPLSFLHFCHRKASFKAATLLPLKILTAWFILKRETLNGWYFTESFIHCHLPCLNIRIKYIHIPIHFPLYFTLSETNHFLRTKLLSFNIFHDLRLLLLQAIKDCWKNWPMRGKHFSQPIGSRSAIGSQPFLRIFLEIF